MNLQHAFFRELVYIIIINISVQYEIRYIFIVFSIDPYLL